MRDKYVAPRLYDSYSNIAIPLECLMHSAATWHLNGTTHHTAWCYMAIMHDEQVNLWGATTAFSAGSPYSHSFVALLSITMLIYQHILLQSSMFADSPQQTHSQVCACHAHSKEHQKFQRTSCDMTQKNLQMQGIITEHPLRLRYVNVVKPYNTSHAQTHHCLRRFQSQLWTPGHIIACHLSERPTRDPCSIV